MDALHQVWLILEWWFWRRRFLLNFVDVLPLFCYYLPLVKSRALYLKKKCILFTWECFVAGFVKIGPVVLEKDFSISSMYYCYFIIISPCKRAWPFIWTNLNPTHPRMLYVKFDWNWPSGSGEEFLIFPQCIQTLDKRWSEKLTLAFSSGELKNVSWERLHPRYKHNKNITIFEVSNTTCSFTQSHVLKVWNMVWFIKMVQFHFQIG